MDARIRQAGKVVWSVAAAAACTVLLSGLVRADALPLSIYALLAVVLATMAWRPIAGVVATVVAVPAAYSFLVLSAANLRLDALTECFVLCALLGAALRSLVIRDDTPSRLAGVAWIFGAIVATSVIVNIARVGSASTAREIVDTVWTHLTGPYLFNPGRFLDLREALRWIEGAALAVVIERALRREPAFAPMAVRMWLVGGAAAAAFAWLRLADVSLRREHPWAAVVFLLRTQRITTLFPDFNAAGSYFALLFVPAVWLGVVRRWWAMLFVVAPIIGLALIVARSRSALAAVAMVIGGAWILRDLRTGHAVRAISVVVVLAGAAYAGSVLTRGTHGSADAALEIRGEMARIALKVSRDQPVFGVGVGQFRAASRAYMQADLVKLFPIAAGGENAHNQFLQVLAELGVAGLIVFLILACGPAWRAVRHPASPEHAALGAGLAAFLVSAALGHPLLIPEVKALFFVALGLCAGLAAPPPAQPAWRTAVVTALVALIVVIALPWRVAAEFRPAGPAFTGAGEIEGEIDGVPFRRAGARLTWLFSPYARAVEVPMRWATNGGRECTVALRLDGRDADVVQLSTDDWRRVRFPVPPVTARTAERRLELRVEPDACVLLVGPMTLTR